MRSLWVCSVLVMAACLDGSAEMTSDQIEAARAQLSAPRSFTVQGTTYWAEYYRYGVDNVAPSPNGTQIRAYGMAEGIDVSRGNDPQFIDTPADRDEAIKAATVYCSKIGLDAVPGGVAETYYSAGFAEDKPSWTVKGICTLPPDDPRG